MNFKLVISDPKHRKAYQKEIDQNQSGFMGKRIGEKVSGNQIGLSGYELEITGGSDRQGFPMRRDMDGIGRKRLLLALPPGFHPKIKGQRKRKSVRGNTISSAVSQINVKVVTHGKETLDKLLGAKPKTKEGETKENGEKPIEKKAEEKPKEAEPKKEEAKPKEKPNIEEKPTEEKMGVKDLEKAESEAKEKESK
jgi:small subunit ribosomal protein S6e